MERPSRIACLFLVLTALFMSSTRAALVVYTDRAAWETAVLAGPFDHYHDQNFENSPTGSLFTGDNFYFPLMVTIPGTPGFNATLAIQPKFLNGSNAS